MAAAANNQPGSVWRKVYEGRFHSAPAPLYMESISLKSSS